MKPKNIYNHYLIFHVLAAEILLILQVIQKHSLSIVRIPIF
jgi:hypothetical protein